MIPGILAVGLAWVVAGTTLCPDIEDAQNGGLFCRADAAFNEPAAWFSADAVARGEVMRFCPGGYGDAEAAPELCALEWERAKGMVEYGLAKREPSAYDLRTTCAPFAIDLRERLDRWNEHYRAQGVSGDVFEVDLVRIRDGGGGYDYYPGEMIPKSPGKWAYSPPIRAADHAMVRVRSGLGRFDPILCDNGSVSVLDECMEEEQVAATHTVEVWEDWATYEEEQ